MAVAHSELTRTVVCPTTSQLPPGRLLTTAGRQLTIHAHLPGNSGPQPRAVEVREKRPYGAEMPERCSNRPDVSVIGPITIIAQDSHSASCVASTASISSQMATTDQICQVCP